MNVVTKPNLRTRSQTYSAAYDSRMLTYLSAGYIFILLFIGRFEIFQQVTIWVFGPLYVFIVLVNYLKHPFPIPSEIYLFALFWLWTLTGYLFAEDLNYYFRYFRLIFTILVLFGCLEIVLSKSGNVEVFYKLFILLGMLYFSYNIISGDFIPLLLGEENWRYGGLASDSNWNAYMLFTSMTGVLFFWTSTKKSLYRIFLRILLYFFIVSIILTASRGGFLGMMVLITLWLIMYYWKKFKKNRFLIILFIAILFPLVMEAHGFIISNTYLGERLSFSIERESGFGSEQRVGLYVLAFNVFLSNPFFGIGLGQFLVLTDYTAISHSDYMELLSTTGIMGLFLYLLIYIIIFRKIIRLKRKVRDKITLYRLNLFIITMVTIMVFGFFRTNFLNIVAFTQLGVIGGYLHYLDNKYIRYVNYIKYKKKIQLGKTATVDVSNTN